MNLMRVGDIQRLPKSLWGSFVYPRATGTGPVRGTISTFLAAPLSAHPGSLDS